MLGLCYILSRYWCLVFRFWQLLYVKGIGSAGASASGGGLPGVGWRLVIEFVVVWLLVFVGGLSGHSGLTGFGSLFPLLINFVGWCCRRWSVAGGGRWLVGPFGRWVGGGGSLCVRWVGWLRVAFVGPGCLYAGWKLYTRIGFFFGFGRVTGYVSADLVHALSQ